MALSSGLSIDTKDFGLALDFTSPSHNRTEYWRVVFDTGIVMQIPHSLFMRMQFHLPEEDPPSPFG